MFLLLTLDICLTRFSSVSVATLNKKMLAKLVLIRRKKDTFGMIVLNSNIKMTNDEIKSIFPVSVVKNA